jgi:septal ring factor EnvC (AmiA/AmiB activator)
MIADELAQQWHDKASRGGALSPEEQRQLDEWLAAQDLAESRQLSSADEEPALAALRSQVDSALAQVGTVTRQLQQLSSDNDALRREIAALRTRLAARPASQPA